MLQHDLDTPGLGRFLRRLRMLPVTVAEYPGLHLAQTPQRSRRNSGSPILLHTQSTNNRNRHLARRVLCECAQRVCGMSRPGSGVLEWAVLSGLFEAWAMISSAPPGSSFG